MLSLFSKKRKNLTDLFPKTFVDIHSHLLPGIDDGSKNMDETVALLKTFESYGVSKLIITPHIMEGVWENNPNIIKSKLEEVNSYLKKNNLKSITISAAAEYMLDANFDQLLKSGEKLLCLKDNLLLVEMSYLNAPVNLFQTLFEIQIANYKPVLAHPERYNFYHNNFSAYKKLKEAGCLFQLNLLALSPYYGTNVQKTAIKLLKENMYDYVGTDTHHQRHLNHLQKITDKKVLKLVAPLLEKNSLFY